MRYFPSASRRRAPCRRLSRSLLVPLAVAALTMPIATQAIAPAVSSDADDLREERKEVQAQIREAHQHAEESSARVARSVEALKAATRVLAGARADLAGVRDEAVRRPRRWTPQMQAQLVRPRPGWTRRRGRRGRRAAGARGPARVVKDLVVSLYQQGDPTLTSLSGYLGAQSPSDLIRHEEYADSASAKQSGIFDDLTAAEALLRVRENEVKAARDAVAEQRRAAADNLVAMQTLTEQAVAAKQNVIALVADNEAAKRSRPARPARPTCGCWRS